MSGKVRVRIHKRFQPYNIPSPLVYETSHTGLQNIFAGLSPSWMLNECIRTANVIEPSSPSSSTQAAVSYSSQLETCLQYEFRDKNLLDAAVTRLSKASNQNYERLEYLGDAVLDLIVSNHYFNESPLYTPDHLTKLRSSITNNNTLGAVATKFGFDTEIKNMHPGLASAVATFRRSQNQNGHLLPNQSYVAKIENTAGGSPRVVAHSVHVPGVLADVFEAVAGAIYVDSNSLEVVASVYDRFLQHAYANTRRRGDEVLMDRKPLAKIRIDQASGQARATILIDNQTFIGMGSNKKDATLAACNLALQELNLI